MSGTNIEQSDLEAIERLAAAFWQNAEDKGFHDPSLRPDETSPRRISLPERLMLIVSELAEVLEEVRAGRDMIWFESDKPEGVAVEVADAFIRLLDMCYEHDIPLAKALLLKQQYNRTRARMHGGKTL